MGTKGRRAILELDKAPSEPKTAIEAGARALTEMVGLKWDLIKDEWREEMITKARCVVVACARFEAFDIR